MKLNASSPKRSKFYKSQKERKTSEAIGTAKNIGWYFLNFYISHYQGGKQEKTQGDAHKYCRLIFSMPIEYA